MKQPFLIQAILLLVQAGCLLSQNPNTSSLVAPLTGISADRVRAEAGDSAAQVALGRAYAGRGYHAEALGWFQKSAAQQNMDGVYEVGSVLLNGRPSVYGGQQVSANPQLGIRCLFHAATNYHKAAYLEIASAFGNGRGVSNDLVESYAWYYLHSLKEPFPNLETAAMNNLALKLDAAAILRAVAMAKQFQAGSWSGSALSVPPAPPVPDATQFKLTGITIGKSLSMAIINGKNLRENELSLMAVGPAFLSVKCLKITSNTVLISVWGESTPRELHLR
ncbi:MAG: hypothetical protein WCO56_27240 [Verrucomicrobiota bacterium]